MERKYQYISLAVKLNMFSFSFCFCAFFWLLFSCLKSDLTWSVMKRISFNIKLNSYSVCVFIHVWCVTASGIRVLPIGPMLPSSPCLNGRPKHKTEWNSINNFVFHLQTLKTAHLSPLRNKLNTHKLYDKMLDCGAVFRLESSVEHCENRHQYPKRWPTVISRSWMRN